MDFLQNKTMLLNSSKLSSHPRYLTDNRLSSISFSENDIY